MRFKTIILSIVCLLLCISTYAQKKKADNETMEFRYEAEATSGQAAQGFILIKVYSYAKNQDVAMKQAGKNAVHAVLFKGVAAYNSGSVRLPSQKPIITDITAYDQNIDFFKSFFEDGGKYQQFVELVNNGIPAAGDVIKVGKEYKVGVKVLVNKAELRKALETAGIIKKLDSGF